MLRWPRLLFLCRRMGCGVRAATRAVCGDLSWHPPGWIRVPWHWVCGLAQRLPRRCRYGLGLAVLAMALAGGTIWWWTHRPQPQRIAVTLTPPGVTNNAEILHPDPIRLRFGEPVAPLEAIGVVVTDGITLTPSVPGEWTWTDGRTLVFRPREDWPAGTRYTVATRPDMYAAQTRLAEYTLQFTTPVFQAEIPTFSFYQDPQDPALKKMVGTIRFSHPVDLDGLDGEIALERFGDEKLGGDATPIPFTGIADRHRRTVYVHSEKITLAEKDYFMRLRLDDGARTTLGTVRLETAVENTAVVPGFATFFRVEEIQSQIVRNADDDPEQLLIVRLRDGVRPKAFYDHFVMYALPVRTARDVADAVVPWESISEVPPDVLAAAPQVPCTPLPSAEAFTTLLSCRYRQAPGTTLYVLVKQGLASFGGYRLAEAVADLVTAPAFPTELRFTPAGSLLALHGARTLSLQSRGIHRVELEFARVLPQAVRDLAVWGTGDFSAPEMWGGHSEEHIAEIFADTVRLGTSDPARAHYTPIDLGKHLQARRGIFLITARGWAPDEEASDAAEAEVEDEDGEDAADELDRRLVLVTDLGLLHKHFADGSHEVFVYSLQHGGPLGGVEVSMLARNGLALHTFTSNAEGAVVFPPLGELRRERTPVVITAAAGDDMAFLPFGKSERELNFSNFDVEGTQLYGKRHLTAAVFSDRGIYRPGELLRAGVIVKDSEWQRTPAGVPLEIVVKDPRGLVVQREKIALPLSGYCETTYQTDAAGLTGTYNVNVYLVAPDYKQVGDEGEDGLQYLGSTAVKVEEFLPDQMKITTTFSQPIPKGWVHPDALGGKITLMNLYGTPATGRRVTGTLTRRPVYPALPGYEDYTFFNPLKFENVQTEDLVPQQTDSDGTAVFDFGLDRFAHATYRLEFLARGFAAEGGRGVESSTAVLVSPLDILTGYTSDASLAFLPRGSAHTVQVIAVDRDLQQVAQAQIHAELIRKRYISTLIEQQDGTLKYQSVLKEETVSQETVAWPKGGWDYPVPTGKAGDFVLRLYDAQRTRVAQIPFAVAGAANLTRSLDRSAELEMVIDQAEYNAGDDITLQIEAPYAGAGLITIERDRVFARKWFRTDTPTTVQTIRIPDALEGNAYVNVAFVRARDSPEIYVSPLAYGVLPFTIRHAHREEGVTLEVPELVRPGDELAVQYRTARESQIVVWAVDEGILQFAGYVTPDPLETFFQKRALEVRAFQTLDLIMPEYALYQQTAAPGGDQSYKFLGNNLNPFRRRTEPPVAFWSGIIPSGPDGGVFRIRIPDSFDGRLRVMATAVNDGHIGVAEATTTVRGPFVISPTLPLFAAPGDRFQVSAIVANQVEGSGEAAQVALAATGTSGLRLDGEAAHDVVIPEGQERAVHFTFTAGEQLGDQRVQLTATLGEATRTASTSLAVRPAAAYQSTIVTAFADARSVTVKPPRQLYPDLRTMEVSVAKLPHGVGRGLGHYLAEYPYDCTEQLVSKSIAALVATRNPELHVGAGDAVGALTRRVAQLRGRQLGSGAFRYWPAAAFGGDDASAKDLTNRFTTLYAVHLLFELDADNGRTPLASTLDMRQRALYAVREFLKQPISTLPEAHLYAYATYLLTRNGEVTSNYLANLLEYLGGQEDADWQQSVTATFIAATHQLLKQGKAAEKYRAMYAWQASRDDAATDGEDYFFLSPATQDALHTYLLATHFPAAAQRLTADDLRQLAHPLETQHYHTVSAAYALLGLSALSRTLDAAPVGWRIESANGEGAWSPLRSTTTGLLTVAPFGDDANALRIGSPKKQPIFYQLVQRGFDRLAATEPSHQGLEVTRQLTDAQGKPVVEVAVGDAVTVRLRVRALGEPLWGPVTIVDLLPAGLEIRDAEALRQGGSAIGMPTAWRPEYVDVREDRVVLYGHASWEGAEFAYEARAVSPGTFQVPPIYGEAMYRPALQSRGVTGTITVVPAGAAVAPTPHTETKK